MRRLVPLAMLALLAVPVAARQSPGTNADSGTTAFESYVESLRQQAGIPAISGALLLDGVVVWERGLGFANLESRVRATPDTPYPVADLSQTLAAVLLLQCVEQGHISLDDPAGNYGAAVPESGATVRQVLSHSSSGTFRYEPDRYAQLTLVMEHCAPQPYRKSVAHRLLDPLAMIDSVPGREMRNPNGEMRELFTETALDRYERALDRLAVPYRVDRKGRATRSDAALEPLNAATGLISTVRDLARFDAALDSGRLLREESRIAAWSPASGGDRTALPSGLGWFVQTYRGTPVVWHFGMVPNGYSAMVVKIPTRRVTMILLANSDGLVTPSQLETGDVTRSLFASIFLRMFV